MTAVGIVSDCSALFPCSFDSSAMVKKLGVKTSKSAAFGLFFFSINTIK